MNMLSVYVSNNALCADALADAKADSSDTIERLHKRRSVLAAFAKLISFNCVPIKYAAETFRAYIKYAPAYMDIIKHLMSACRDISKVNTAKTLCLALQREYTELVYTLLTNQTQSTPQTQAQANQIDRAELSSLKELAHRFCLSFGPDASTKSREAIVAIHL